MVIVAVQVQRMDVLDHCVQPKTLHVVGLYLLRPGTLPGRTNLRSEGQWRRQKNFTDGAQPGHYNF